MRFLLGLWFLVMVILSTAYTCNITAYFSVPKLKPIVNSYEELATSNHYKLTIMASSAMADLFLVITCSLYFWRSYLLIFYLQNSTREPYKTLGDSLRKNPHLLIKDSSKVADVVLKYDGAFATVQFQNVIFLISQFKRFCRQVTK